MEDTQKTISLRQHNVITNARHDLTAVQLDIYFMLLSRLKPTDNIGAKYEISVKEIESLTGRVWNYQQLRDATSGLIGKVFEIEEEDGLLQVALMASAKYLKGKGTIQLSVAEELKPYLVMLKNNFTSFELFCVLSMSSKYAKWLYVQFSRWKDKGYLSIEVDQLRKQLNLKDSKGKEQYKQWGQFKDNVLDPSIKQINRSTDLHITYTIEKKQRTIHKINFMIRHTPQFQTMIPFELSEYDQVGLRLKQRMIAISILDNKLIKIVLDSPEMREKAVKVLYETELKKAGLKSPAGYFRKLMGI